MNTEEHQQWAIANAVQTAEWKMANHMRVLACALITSYQKDDSHAFYATAELIQDYLSEKGTWAAEDFRLFAPFKNRPTAAPHKPVTLPDID